MNFGNRLEVSQDNKIIFDPSKNEALSAALLAKTPADAAARDQAVKIEGLAVNFYSHVNTPGLALQAAEDKINLQTEITQTLNTADGGLKTAQYLDAIQAADHGQASVPIGDNTYLPLPTVTFSMDAGHKLNEICFGDSRRIHNNPRNTVCSGPELK